MQFGPLKALEDVFVNITGVLTHWGVWFIVKLATGALKIFILSMDALVESQEFMAETLTINWFPGKPQEDVLKIWNIESVTSGVVHITVGEPSPKFHL